MLPDTQYGRLQLKQMSRWWLHGCQSGWLNSAFWNLGNRSA